jgi:succinoglycan biosynthesis transport protein ExoP
VDDFAQEGAWGASDYIGVVRRRWKLAAVTAAVVLVVGLVISLSWPPTYRSTATILIEQQEIPQDLVRSTITSFADQRIQLINQRVMITSNLLDIIRQNGLYADDFDSKPREEIIERMRRDIHMDMVSANVLDPRNGQPTRATIAFTVGYDNRVAALAARVANQLTSLYLQQNSETRRQQAAEAVSFLGEEAQRLAGEISTYETRLAEFKQANRERLPELATLNQQFMNRAEEDLADVRRQRNLLDERRAYLEAQLAQLSPSRDAAGGSADMTMDPAERLRTLEAYLANVSGVYTESHPDVVRTRSMVAALRAQLGVSTATTAADVEQELAELRTTRDALLQRYEPQHPDVVRVESQIAATESRLSEMQTKAAPPTPRATNPVYMQLQSQLQSDSLQRQQLDAREGELHKRISELEERLAQTPGVERDYSALARGLESTRLKYQEVSTKQREAVVSQNLEMDAKSEHFSLIEPPLLPQRPISPNRFLILAAAFVLALVGAASGVALRELFDNSVKGPTDFERLLGVAPLGVIPAIFTTEDLRLRGRRRVQVVAATAVAVLVAIVLAHVFIAPLDALWFGALRRFGV